TICHRTNSNTNPYVIETVDIASSGHLKGGHDTEHEGPVWNPSLKADKIEWGDIIPAYTYEDFSYPGQNMDEGGAILEAGCEVEAPSEQPSEEPPSETPSEEPGDPSEQPSEEPSEPPADTPSAKPTPEGSVEAATGTPHEGLTPPPTDTID